MDPKSARDKADQLEREADKLKEEAQNLRADADDREEQVRQLNQQITQVALAENQAKHNDDPDEAVRLTHELRELEAKKRSAQIGGGSSFF